MKKLLLLGGLKYLIPVIKKAKKLGFYVITCDYLPENIAHQYSDEYHNVSIIDQEAVLSLAQNLKIDGIMSFAVDPGVLTAAYVSDQMNLPSPGPYESIQILQNKALFRSFLEKNNFNVPQSKSYQDLNLAVDEFNQTFPVMVKPVDSAGSKGVSKVNSIAELKIGIEKALKESPTKTFIIEEFLESDGYASDSDCFSINGNLEFVTFSNQRFDEHSPNPYTPSGFTWPSTIPSKHQEYLTGELRRLIKLLNMKSSIYNIEVRLATDGKPYIMEVSPRGGGNRIAEMIEYATTVDLISYSIKAAMGKEIESMGVPEYKTNLGQFVLHNNKKGQFKKIVIHPEIQSNLFELDMWIKENDVVNAFAAANDSIGTAVFKFDNKEKLEHVISNYSNYIDIKVE
ncbi:MAG: ATP-grasp domain-containing protein [Bacteroidota bacterium]